MKRRRLNWKPVAAIVLAVFIAGLFVALGGSRLGEGAEWLWAVPGALFGLYLLKGRVYTWREQPEKRADAAAVSYLPSQSPRAAMERRWRRLGSVRGNLLADSDRQSDLSEALYRLEYGPKAVEDRSWLPSQDRAQAHDLQMPAGVRKRKGKPKRQR